MMSGLETVGTCVLLVVLTIVLAVSMIWVCDQYGRRPRSLRRPIQWSIQPVGHTSQQSQGHSSLPHNICGVWQGNGPLDSPRTIASGVEIGRVPSVTPTEHMWAVLIPT